MSLKCPLTSCYLEDPVSNPQCGHTYSKAAVIRHVNIQLRSVAGVADKALHAMSGVGLAALRDVLCVAAH